ncbi:hypothetical protein BGX23_003847 [Mortierella sp. AD031]|nr:hypothetical protein BGX23_003847 [Mortierella sp. AD031]
MNTVVDAISRVSAASSPAILSLIHQLTRKNLPKLLGVYILLYIFKYRRTALGVEPRSDLRGPKGLPLLGDTVLVTLHSQNESLQLTEKLHEKYGPTYAFTIPLLGRILQFKDPAVLEQVLKTNFWAYEKGPEMQHTLHDLLGLGIFSADGHYTSDVFVKEANVMADYLGAMADEGKTVDIHKLLYLYTLDSFGE